MRRPLLLLALSLITTPASAEEPWLQPAPWAYPGGHRLLSLGLWRGAPAWGAWVGLRLPLEVAPTRPTGRPEARPPEAPAEPTGVEPGRAPRIAPARLRRLLRAAYQAAGVSDARMEDLASRARRAALLPEMRLRAMRSSDQALRYSPIEDDDTRAQATGQAGTLYEVRLTFRLDRLVFADEEVAIERLRQEAQQQRARVAQRLTELLGAYQRGSARASLPGLSDEERAEAQVAAEAASAGLDLLTDGAWSTP